MECNHERWIVSAAAQFGNGLCLDCKKEIPLWMLLENMRSRLQSLIDINGTTESKFVELYIAERQKRMQLEQIVQNAIATEARIMPMIEFMRGQIAESRMRKTDDADYVTISEICKKWEAHIGDLPEPAPEIPPADAGSPS